MGRKPCQQPVREDAMNLKKTFTILFLVVIFQPTTQPVLNAGEKEPVDIMFDEILAMYQDLEVDRFFELAGQPAEYRTAIDFDPTGAEYFDRANEAYQFTTDEVDMLSEQGFFVRETGWQGGFAVIYYNIYARDLPVLVTTDSLLHAMHKSYDDILKELEVWHFSPAIATVLDKTRKKVQAMSRSAAGDEVSAALVDADAYLTIAMSLLKGDQVPTLLGDNNTVIRVLDNVDSLRMLVPRQDEPIEIFGEKRWIDFSQFKPRGHYTESEQLERYFRCLMWLGRADTGMNVLDNERQLMTAALLVHALEKSGQFGPLQQIDQIINFMVGRSDNLTPFGLSKAMGELKLNGLKSLGERDALAALAKGIREGRAGTQMIRSQMVVSWPTDTVKVKPPSLFQLFGQRYIIDSFVLSKVVYDDIIYEGVKQKRVMPSPLDVMAALGNGEALALLEGQLRAWNYSANLKAAQDFVASHKDGFWQDNLYNLWLDALRVLDRPMTDEHAPQAMQTRAWQHKQLNTQLASWAQLRHDTILYAKQSYTASIGCEYPKGYVEPYPEFYARLGFFGRRAGELFLAADFIPEANRKRYAAFFNNMEQTMEKLETLAQKELAAESFSRSEQKWMEQLIRRQDGNGYGASAVYSGWYVDLFYSGQETAIDWDPTVADVHTDPNSRKVLEVGVGHIDTLFLAVDNEEDHSLFVGPTLSYYEFLQPAEKRMTDPEWKSMLVSGEAPDRPAWSDSFLP